MAYIKAVASYLPPSVLTNEDLKKRFPDEDIEKLSKGVGVLERHIAKEDQTSSDLAYEAARNLFSKSGISPYEIDFLIYDTHGPDYFFPSTACVLQNRLGLPTTAGAFGIDLGCSGWTYGIAVANSFVESGLAKNVLLLNGDTFSQYLHPDDRNRVLFCDGAAATLIAKDGFAKIGKTVYGTDGSGSGAIIMKNRGFRHLETTGYEENIEGVGIRRDDYFSMDGEAVFKFTIDRVPQLIEDILKRNDITENDIDLYVFHQANKFMLNALRKTCGIDKEKFYINLENTGNTSSSTIPIVLERLMSQKAIKQGQKVMIAGFGVGFSWAGTVLEF